MKMRILLLCGAMLIPSTGWSFNCANAVNVTERAICSYPNVKASDDRMANQYWSLMHRFNAKGQDFLKKDQIAWIQERQKVCGGNAECLLSYNNERYHDLSQVIQQFDIVMKQPAQTSPYVLPQQSYVQQPSRTYSRTLSIPPSRNYSIADDNGCMTFTPASGEAIETCQWTNERMMNNIKKGAFWLGTAAVVGAAVYNNSLSSSSDDVPEEPRGSGLIESIFAGVSSGNGGETSSGFTPKEHHHKHEDKQVDPYPKCEGGLYNECHNPNFQSWD